MKHDKLFSHSLRNLVVACGIWAGGIGAAQAAVTIVANEVGADVVITYSGTIDTAGLTFVGSATTGNSGFNGTFSGTGGVYNNTGSRVAWSGVTGTGVIGSFSFIAADIVSGDPFTMIHNPGQLRTETGYISGSPISGQLTFLGDTLASLGITEGTNTAMWSWGSGGNADSATFSAFVPEPSRALLTLLGVGLIGFQRKRR